MITADDVRAKQFSKAGMSGYKQVEVDAFLNEIEADLQKLTDENAAKTEEIESYKLQIDEYKANENVLQTALLNAQKLAEQIITDAKESARKMTTEAEQKARETVAAANLEASGLLERAKEQAEKLASDTNAAVRALTERTERETTDKLVITDQKAKDMIAAAVEAVRKEQENYDRLKVEVASFKRDILDRYNSQIELISTLPADVELPPKESAKAAAEVKTVKPEHAEEKTAESGHDENTPSDDAIVQKAERLGEMIREMHEADVSAEKPDQAQTDAPDDAGQKSEIKSEEAPIRRGGFKVIVDDDDEHNDEEGGRFKFGGSAASRNTK